LALFPIAALKKSKKISKMLWFRLIFMSSNQGLNVK